MAVEGAILAAGLILLLGGGEALVRGASALAARLGVAPVLVGLTVVAFGTSAPELVVTVAAALRGSTEIGFGNVVGSNIANVGLLMAIGALIRPLAVNRTLVAREIPMMVVASLLAVVLGATAWFGGDGPGYARADGVILLLCFAGFMVYTVSAALAQRDRGKDQERPGSTGRSVILILGGLVALVAGGELTVRGATAIAQAVGISEAVIGLTVVAVGTSLPELATTLSAARSGEGDIAVGNIVGSNLFNLLFVWGIAVTLVPSRLPAGGMTDLLVMAGFALILLPLAVTDRGLGRMEGLLMLIGYAGFVGWLIVG